VERGRGVARPAAQPGACGDSLGELDRHAESTAGRFQHGLRRAHGEIRLGRPEIGAVHGERNAGLGAPDD